MNRIYIFILRAILGGVFAVIAVRVFRPQAGVGFTVLLGAILVALAYLREYYRKRSHT
ncbi:MAG: hypothetical protein WBG37_16010 [Desulfobacterales bacterium]|jgi:hypothetical protein